MPDPLNSSFIPKRGPTTHQKQKSASRQVYVFTLFSYIIIFATLLSAGGMFLYQKYLHTQLDEEIAALDIEIASFSKADMQKVLDFNNRLQQASGRLRSSVSIVSIFKALEAATIDTVMLENLNMQREGDDKYLLSAQVQTDSFDSTIFQRGVMQRNQTISAVTISSLQAASQRSSEVGEVSGSAEGKPLVSFTAELEVPVSAVPYEPTAVTELLSSSLEDSIVDDNIDPITSPQEDSEERSEDN